MTNKDYRTWYEKGNDVLCELERIAKKERIFYFSTDVEDLTDYKNILIQLWAEREGLCQ